MKQDSEWAKSSVSPKKANETNNSDQRSGLRLFIMATLNMSWQLAIVVLVPLIGGYEIDRKIKSFPLLTIIGMVLAMTGTALVLHRQLQQFGPPPASAKKGPVS